MRDSSNDIGGDTPAPENAVTAHVVREEPPALPMRILGLLFGLVVGAVGGFVFGFVQAFFVTPSLMAMPLQLIGTGSPFATDSDLFEAVLRGGVYVLTPGLALLFGWLGWRGRGLFTTMLTTVLAGILGLGMAVLVAIGVIDEHYHDHTRKQPTKH